MKYKLAKEEKPMTGVDVHVVTDSGVKSIARCWGITGKWLTQDKKLGANDTVKKWKYADAT